MSFLSSARLLFVLTLAIEGTASCGGDATGVGSVVSVVVTTSGTEVLPGQHVIITVNVTAPKKYTIDSVIASTTGAFESSRNLATAPHQGSFVTSEVVQIPLSYGTGSLDITVIAYAAERGHTGVAKVAVADTAHPTLRIDGLPEGALESGDTVSLTLYAQDYAALAYTSLKMTGSFTLTDSVSAGYDAGVARTFTFTVPVNASLTTPLQITGMAVNAGGVATTLSPPAIAVIDTAHPAISGSLATSHAAGGAAPGDTITLTIHASDRRKLAYVGYRFGPPANVADSVSTSGQTYSVSTPIVVPPTWIGTSSYTIFARDSMGNRTERVLGSLTAAARSRRAITSVSLSGAVRDAAFDMKRGRVYMSIPSQNQVASLSLSDMTFGAPYSFQRAPHGVDVTPGGDSLIVALVDTIDMSIINIPSGTATNFRVASPGLPPGSHLWAENVRIANNGKAIFTLGFEGFGYGSTLYEADLSTGGLQRLATVTDDVPLAAAGDRSRVLALIDDSCCPEDALVYDADKRTLITQATTTINRYYNWVSADLAGDRFMIESSVYTQDFHPVTSYTGDAYTGGPSSLSPDGQSGYFATATGIIHVRFSDGATIETFALGAQPDGMWLSSDGLTILATTATRAYVVDLW